MGPQGWSFGGTADGVKAGLENIPAEMGSGYSTTGVWVRDGTTGDRDRRG